MWDYLFNNFWCLNTVTRWHLLSLSSFYPLITSSIIESKLVKGKWKLEESRSTYCWVQSYCKEESRTSLHRLQIIIVKSSKRKKKKKKPLFKEQNQSCGLIMPLLSLLPLHLIPYSIWQYHVMSPFSSTPSFIVYRSYILNNNATFIEKKSTEISCWKFDSCFNDPIN
jgi:hypothetical protein